MKIFKRICLSVLLIIILVAGFFTVAGYTSYREAIKEYPLKDAVLEIQSRADYVKTDSINKDFLNAVVAVEDRRFYTRNGVDFIALGRALVANIMAGEIVEGGSTIAQQVGKNIYFDNRTSLVRKIAEMFLLYDLEAEYSKEVILELYVNIIYYGDLYYGISQASKGYFKKEPADLSLAEASVLAGLPQSPSRYQLSSGTELAKKRQKVVLEAMFTNGYIDEAQKQDALQWGA